MRSLNNTAVYKALLLAGCAGTVAVASPAMAQDDDAEPPISAAPQTEEADDGDATIIVTGSRIQRQDFSATTPTVTVDEEFLEQSSTAAVEQQLNKLPQFVVSQSSTVKNSEGVLTSAGGDIQPNATNTPGAATVSLRGVGSNRTLVLINGRRGTPGNASGTVDISTIPSAALQRVETISGGASATYGADAVAGVTNFILKQDFQGIELDGSMGISQYGDAFEYQLGGIMGSDFEDGRGNVSIAMSMNTREAAYQRDRPWFQDLWHNPNTGSAGFFQPRPGISGISLTDAQWATVFPGANPPVPASNTTVFFNEDGTPFTTGFAARGGSAFFKPWPDVDKNVIWKTTAVDTLASSNTFNYLTVPTTRYNFLARGNYEINDWIGVFGHGMFSHTETYTAQEPGPIVGGWGISIPWGDGVYTGNKAVPASVLRNGDLYDDDGLPFTPDVAYVDSTGATLGDNPTNPAFTELYGGMLACANDPTGGCTNTEAFQQVIPLPLQNILEMRTDNDAPFALQGLLPNLRETFSDVTTYNLVAGLEGSIPGMDWTWEAYVNHGVSTTVSRQTGMYSLERLRAVYSAPNFGQGFSYTGNPEGAGFGASSASCTSGIDFFNAQGKHDAISQDCREAIAADMSTKGEARQTIAEVNLQGGLFELPAGQLRFAVGASYRENYYEFINETLAAAGRSFLDQALGIYPSANTSGFIDVRELYGELLIPVLSDIPLVERFELEVGGRMSDYSTTGTSYTFKVLGNWEVTDWLRFRGGFNRAERAPNIAELLLAPQQAFRTDPTGDLCSQELDHPASANPETNAGGAAGAADVQAICLALMARDNDGVFVPTTDPNSFYGPIWGAFQPAGPGAGFGYAVGNQVYRETIDPSAPALKPEVADTWTAGMVISSPTASGPLSRLQLAIDYFNIKIEDPIGLISAGAALQRCVDPTFNPAVTGASTGGVGSAASQAAANAAIQSLACEAVFRNPSDGAFGTGGLNTARIITTYGNDGLIKLSGVDALLSWGVDVGPGSLFASLNANYMIDFKAKELDSNPLVDYVGTTGTGIKGLNFGSSFEYRIFGTVGYNLGPASLSLQWQHIPATEDAGEALGPTDDMGLPAYNLFNLNGSYQLNEAVRIRFGVDNLFNKRPPLSGIDADFDPAEGQLPGGSYSFFHDQQGRRFSLGANLRF